MADSSKMDNQSTEDLSTDDSTDEGGGYTRQQKITLATVLVSQFCVMTSFSLPSPFLPKLVGMKILKALNTKYLS